MSDFFDTMNAPKVVLIIVTVYVLLDLFVLGLNAVINKDKDWFLGPFIITRSFKEDKDVDSATTGTELGEYKKYAGNKTGLNETDIRRIIRDHDNNEVITGYTGLELLAYVIVPLVTFLSIAWWGISTRASKAEWTFWILIGTLIFTVTRTVVSVAGGDAQLIPDSKPPIETIAGKLGITAGDEFKYNLIARKGDGKECLIEGDWPSTEKNPPIFRGGSTWKECSMENLLI